MAKLHQLPFSISVTNYIAPLELVYLDLWGPAPVHSRTRIRYCVCFIDAFSKYTCIYLLVNKSQMFQAFVEFKTMMESKTGSKLKALQTDNGKEYMPYSFS